VGCDKPPVSWHSSEPKLLETACKYLDKKKNYRIDVVLDKMYEMMRLLAERY